MMKEFSLIRFYFVLTISVIYFAAQLVLAHWAHCLILQIDSYHMLYNILSLITGIVTVRMSRYSAVNAKSQYGNKLYTISDDRDPLKDGNISVQSSLEGSLKSTFGWTRIDVCGTVASLCFLAALCFSMVAESIQTMAHASHHFSMSLTMSCRPDLIKAVIIVGAAGLAVNLICVLTIGGYTFHQSNLLRSDHDHIVIQDDMSSTKRRRQGLVATVRDIFGTILVIIVGTVFYTVLPTAQEDEYDVVCNGTSQFGSFEADPHGTSSTAQVTLYDAIYYLDPGFCIVTVIVLMLLSYSYAKEAGHILLLTIPDDIDVKSLSDELHEQFPEIYDIHELHLWQLTPGHAIVSAHIVLGQAQNYLAIRHSMVDFLHAKGIKHVTLQPEFVQDDQLAESPSTTRHRKCFLPCNRDNCREQQCCESSHVTISPCNSLQPLDQVSSHGHSHHHHHDS